MMKQSLQYISMLPGKWVACCLLMLISLPGCRKYLEVPRPISTLTGSAVFTTDFTAAAALNSIYINIYNRSDFDGLNCVGYLTGLYGDEFRNYSLLPSNQVLYANAVSTTIGNVIFTWTKMYNQLYSVNAAIEGLTPATSLSYRDQLLGEAYFLRGLLYFYLTNLYGEAPLVLGSDYLHNNGLGRSPQAEVYQQIVADLQQAQSLLPAQYREGNGLATTSRGRPNKTAATALLARVYLYMHDWQNASAQAGIVIADAANYKLVNPAQTFLVNSNEIIWGIVPGEGLGSSYLVKDAPVYILTKGLTPLEAFRSVSLSDSLVNAFEAGDLRYTNWVGIDSVPARGGRPAAVYYFAYKYKANGTYTAAQESIVMLRLAEQYLIRAEARAQQGDVGGALADMNAVRARAALTASTAQTQPEVLSAIQKERRVELFAENGHRFFDLRRTGSLDALMTKLTPLKGGVWASFKTWWPIPSTDIESDPRLEQTPGY